MLIIFLLDDDDNELFLWHVDGQKGFILISIRDRCQKSSPLRISDTPQTGYEPEQNMSSDFDE